MKTAQRALSLALCFIEIAAGELYGVAVQIVEHIGNTELGAVFLKNQDILSIVAILLRNGAICPRSIRANQKTWKKSTP